jgi:hypothetical protein
MNLNDFLGFQPAKIQELPSSHGNLEKVFVVSMSERLKSVLARKANLFSPAPPIIVCGYIQGQLTRCFL